MAFGRLERRSAARPMSDINMTPLIDVMLVLLVIFIITAPLMASSLRLELPRAEGGTPSDAPTFISIGLDARGQLYLSDQPLDRETLTKQLAESARREPQPEVQLRADRQVPYGEVAALIGLIQQAGFASIGFVTEAARAR